MNRPTYTTLAVVLLISIALNLFMAGALLATRWMNRPLGSAVEAVMRAYPQSLRNEVRQRLFDDRDVVRNAFAELVEARRKMFALMRADPLDVEAMKDAMAGVREKTATVQAFLQAALLASLKHTPAPERAKIEPPRVSFGFGLSRLRDDGL